MDEKKLYNEIISCRAAVRKARVAVIRKIIKKMKILKSCKIEGMKEKKLRKSERLFEKIKIMKKAKDDEVAKFALRNKDLEIFLKDPKSDLTQSAFASLAKHDAVIKKVNAIREQFSDWENELLTLLDELEKNKGALNSKSNTVGVKKKMKKAKEKTVVKSKRNNNKPAKEVKKKEQNVIEKVEKIEKIEDPFFIEKKVIAPKLALESSSDELPKKPFLNKNSFNRLPHERTFKAKKDVGRMKKSNSVVVTDEEKLHPSWAAKKVKLIKPFQGKKIMFSDD